ncbi:hypothetical protein Hypma_004176 [Hypsizygus marmoreus]|uniref:Uncharacterized protein n=1 Tax=Hypsizygus marmoreus TaxID=39966 RepID=A0A369J0A6_HYPMA|nr:hypothetical protein Hypma_004176 [Hypsizygus marmoreus]
MDPETPTSESLGTSKEIAPRLFRFADWAPIQDNESPESKEFYQGDGVSQRMGAVRHLIAYIRVNWNNYASLMDGLRAFIGEGQVEPPSEEDRRNLDGVLFSLKQWTNRQQGVPSAQINDYNVTRLYTSDFGFRHIFRRVDSVLRKGVGLEQERDLQSAVFLIELFNIDLFNYVSVTPDANNFQGVVYRGVCVSNEQLQEFIDLAAKPIPERCWAIPLTITSASINRERAIAFAKAEVRQQPDRHLFLWRIHVVELEPELLRVYREQFPTSVVSSICAVPIGDLSPFPAEVEVVLRGPFFQLIRMAEEDVEEAGNVYVMDSLMLNTNRDHPSTMELGDNTGEKARQLFGCLVSMGRAKACQGLAKEFDLLGDVEQYRDIYEEEEARLRTITASG